MTQIFRMLVADMRKAQKTYFVTPRTHYTIKKEILEESKRLECLVDDQLMLMDLPGHEKQQGQYDLIEEINKTANHG